MKFGSWFKPLFFLISFLILVKFGIDPDLGWHLAIGNEFLESGRIIRGDEFSWTMPGYLFGNYFFGYQILVSFIFKYFGHIALSIFFGLLAGLATYILLPRRINLWQTIAAALGIAMAAFVLGVRPSTVSFLMFSILLLLVYRGFFKNLISVLFWFFFFALWANFHQGFLVGLLVLGLYIFLDWLKNKDNGRVRVFTIIAALLGTFLTPFNYLIYKSIFFDITGVKTWNSIAEWGSVVLITPINLIYATSAVVVLFILYRKFRKLDPVLFSVAVVVFSLPFLAVNMLLFWAALYIFVVSRYLDFKVKGEKNFWVVFPVIFASFAVFLAFALNFLVNLLESSNLRQRFIRDEYPIEAIDYMKKNNLGDNLFNEYGWGGFLDWQYRNVKVFIDGRMTGWRNENVYILQSYTELINGNCDVLVNYEIKVALVKNKTYDCFSDWSTVYEDGVAKVLVE